MLKINKIIYLLLLGLFLIPLAQAEWVDISPSVEITQTPQALDRVNRQLFSYVTIKNTSGVIIEAPLQLNIIDPTIPVVNADGLSEDFHSYIQLDDDLVSGTEKIVRVSFQLARKVLSFTAELMKEGAVYETIGGDTYNPPSALRFITDTGIPYIDGSFIVWFVEGTELSTVQQIADSIGATIQGASSQADRYVFVTKNAGLTFDNMLAVAKDLQQNIEVSSATINVLYSFNNVNDISLTVDDDLGNVSINVNMEINNWYQTPNQIEFSSYGMGIMMNMPMQMDLKQNGMTDVFSVSVNK